MSNGTKSRGRRRTWILLAVFAVAFLFAFRLWQATRVESVQSIESVQRDEGKPVEIAVAAVGDLESSVTVAGTVEGAFQYPIISTNAIAIVEVLKKEGDRVKAGDIIIRLEKTAPNPMLHSYKRSAAVFEDAKADAERMRKLFDEGAISKQALEKAEMALAVARSDLENAQESVLLKATYPGVVTSIKAEEGAIADTYAPLAWIARTDSIKIIFDVGSRQAMALAVGQRAVIDAGEFGEPLAGVITKLDLSADPKSHLVKGEALFPNPGRRIMPGLLVSCDVRTVDRKGVLAIPARCLVESGGGAFVYVVQEADSARTVARLTKVKPGLRSTDMVEIRSGVAAGDRVVAFGQSKLSDGDRVRIVKGAEARK